jgi:aryl-alcohol dehydrogenase-like predicted oxidoreductase
MMIDKLILGTAQLGMNYGINNYGKLSEDNVFDILEFAYNNNIKILDTAEIYGEALTLIGLFLKANPKKDFKIISKLSLDNKLQNNDIFQHLESNLKILNTKYYHGYMIHNFKDLKKYPEIYGQLQNAKTRGYINNIGISLYEEYEIIDVVDNYNFDFIQVPFNLLDNEKSKRDILKRAKNKKIDIHVRSIFLQGLFFTPNNKYSPQLKPLNKYIMKINEIAKANKTNLETLAIHYPVKKNYIDKIIIGVHDLKQFDKNIKILNSDIYVPEDEIERIDVKEKELLKPYNWN